MPPEQLYRVARKCGRNLVAAIEEHIRKGEFFDGDELRLTTTLIFSGPKRHECTWCCCAVYNERLRQAVELENRTHDNAVAWQFLWWAKGREEAQPDGDLSR